MTKDEVKKKIFFFKKNIKNSSQLKLIRLTLDLGYKIKIILKKGKRKKNMKFKA